jgi:hypothetical protein
MVQARQIQATDCRHELAWKGIWTDTKGKGWYLEECREYAPKVSSAVWALIRPSPGHNRIGKRPLWPERSTVAMEA